ncbi:MAG TPA: ATP-dependent DNA ligase [Pseudoneobacillus sp.]|nr:ATP-dependent DNA ligase [Pseudoneobacillus sp.]
MNILELKTKFDSIGAVSSRLEKETLIEKYKDDKLFLETLNFVFNPYIVTGIAKKKIERDLGATTNNHPTDILDVFEVIKENNTGTDSIVRQLQAWIMAQHPETHQFLKDVFAKDVQIGISHKTINKVIGKGFIPEYGVQLAKNYYDEQDKVKGPFAITLKLDGLRATAFNEKSVSFFSRKGLPFEGLVELEEVFKKLPKDRVYDGELLAFNPDNIPSKDLFRKTQKVVKTEGIKTGVRFILFDSLPINEFYEGKSKKTYIERNNELRKILNELGDIGGLVELVPTYYIGADKDKVEVLLKHVISEGYEGLMVNTLDGKYEVKRSNNLLKVKKMHSVDLRITGFEEHRKQPNKLGALVVDYKGYKVNVGSGFTDADREHIWNNREQLLNTIVEVQYFEESSNERGGLSLRFPVFLRLRDDKNEVSYH